MCYERDDALFVCRICVYSTSDFGLVSSMQAGAACVNSVSFHPYAALLLAVTGERHYILPEDEIVMGHEHWSCIKMYSMPRVVVGNNTVQ